MVPSIAARRLFVAFIVATLPGCQNHEVEREFFRQPLETRVARLRQYPLETQYKIFRYGNDVVHPPLMDLAIPIAERGAGAVPFLIARLRADEDDFTVRDILRIVLEMKYLNTYDVKSDEALMHALSERTTTMKDKGWQDTCLKMLDEIKE
jgi:hypothetical protein